MLSFNRCLSPSHYDANLGLDKLWGDLPLYQAPVVRRPTEL